MASRYLGFLGLLALAVLWAGCHDLGLNMGLFKFRESSESREKRVSAALRGAEGHSKLVGDYINISGLNAVVLEGVALVTNLDGTGDDPPASPYRTALMEDMKKRKIPNPNELLRDPTTTLVLVRAYLPPLIKTGEVFDVEVRLPDGSEATSLNGGWLLECDLTEQQIVPGRGTLKGSIVARAHGPILISTGEGKTEKDTTALKRGVIPAGAKYLGEDRNLSIFLRPDYRSVRMSRRIADRIGTRFHDYGDDGIKRPLAEAKTDSRIELIVHSRYRDNFPRYLQCIRNIALGETTVERHLRVQRLREQLAASDTAAQAALQLEGIGPEAVPVLKQGLKAASLESRFRAAEALSYLGHSEGVAVLEEAADKERAFRVYALAALATLDSGEASMALTRLMDHSSVETRYGAFRALSIRPANEVYIPGLDMDGKFKLHVVESGSEPLVHLTRRKRSEIVIFGAEQKFEAPMFVRAGRRVLVKIDAGKQTAVVSRFAVGEADRRVETSTRVADVIEAASNMGASYPDIVQMLVQAEKQRNLPGRIGIDELPSAGRVYQRPAEGDQAAPGSETQIGDEVQVPNLFEVSPAADGNFSESEDLTGDDQQAAPAQPQRGGPAADHPSTDHPSTDHPSTETSAGASPAPDLGPVGLQVR